MDYATIADLWRTRRTAIMEEVLREIFGTSETFEGSISLGITRSREGRHDPNRDEYALLIRIPGPVPANPLRNVVIDNWHIPVIVKGNYVTPVPL